MKVLMLHDCAGVQLKLSQELRKRGHQVDFYLFVNGWDDPYIKEYEPHKIYGGKIKHTLFLFKKIIQNYYDIIHTYNTRFPSHRPYDYYLMKLLGRKVVVHFHGSDLREYSQTIAVKTLLKNKTCLVATPDLLKWAPNATWLPNPVDPKVFRPYPNEPHDEIRILHAPTDEKLKGTWVLEKAVKELRGKGYKIDLKILGKRCSVPRSDMPKWYGWSDIVVNECICGIHGLIGIEAMLCERPVISTFQNEVREVCDPPIVTIQPNSVESLTTQLEWFINDEDARKKLGVKGRKWAMENHDPEKVTDNLETIYKNA